MRGFADGIVSLNGQGCKLRVGEHDFFARRAADKVFGGDGMGFVKNRRGFKIIYQESFSGLQARLFWSWGGTGEVFNGAGSTWPGMQLL
jgi:hypothetical protein